MSILGIGANGASGSRRTGLHRGGRGEERFAHRHHRHRYAPRRVGSGRSTSVAAFSQESLDQKSVRNIEDPARITPGLSISQGFSGIKYIAIRGLSSSVGATMTGVYVDDTPVQVRSLVLSTNFYPALYDLDRVEVLRGPQGTLFGAGAMGSAVRFILTKPSLTEFSGNMRGERFPETDHPAAGLRPVRCRSA